MIFLDKKIILLSLISIAGGVVPNNLNSSFYGSSIERFEFVEEQRKISFQLPVVSSVRYISLSDIHDIKYYQI